MRQPRFFIFLFPLFLHHAKNMIEFSIKLLYDYDNLIKHNMLCFK
jgi:hypothetical protein